MRGGIGLWVRSEGLAVTANADGLELRFLPLA